MRLPSMSIGVILLTIASCTSILPQLPGHATRSDGNADVILITGVTSRTGQGRKQTGHVPIRREIQDLKDNSPDQWNLYLLGLRAFQAVDESNPVSYYEIAGIHGRPYKIWQGAEKAPGKTGGYCPHGNTLFFGWHRPYLALFEQELYRHIQRIAQQFPANLKARYIAAAQDFRIPYWDWGLGPKGGSVPDFLLSMTIEVLETDGTVKQIPNPLCRYEFHPLVAGDFESKWAAFNTTLRWPSSELSTAVSQPEKVVAEYDMRRRNYRDKIGQAFAVAKGLNEFSTKFIEDVHGWIHYAFGGMKPDGHMWPSDYSAFDPVFMLHHANVDRLFAIWQSLHPEQSTITPTRTSTSNLWIDANTVLDADTPLLPFYRSPTSFWTTNDVRDTAVLGYAYPETQRWNFPSDEEFRSSLNATVSRLYRSSSRDLLEMMVLLDEVDRSFEDWNVRVGGGRGRLPGAFIARFFFEAGEYGGKGRREVGVWMVVTGGGHQAGVQFGEKGKGERKKASVEEMDMQGLVSLTSSLLEEIAAGKLASLDKEDVVPFLRERLSWSVEAGDGSMVSASGFNNGLVVEVVSTRVRIPVDEEQLLEYSDEWVSHPEGTRGKSGGVWW
ncbi:Di-copper centre-containing protein [Westerdykella ornata]|uniref:tyrosinase n=1 Tax=Westerdykella ornata TaxID=318751 RepID=A0A6A6JR23_WESOR|nr:Di-copper centre-containing protein [Westerdykella ornata]KAF2278156.1 Di-copper centre-containing protein [Westerdykella ornata]